MVTRLVLAIVVLFCVATTTSAQFGRGFGRVASRFPASDSFGHGFNFCRAMYTSVRREAEGQGWSTDYPSAEINFSIRLSELTKIQVSKDSSGSPNHLVVRLTDDALFQCPFVQMSDVGTLRFTDPRSRSTAYVSVEGWILWVDDFWGPAAWEAWASQLARVLSPAEYPTQELPLDHRLFRTMFDVTAVPQIPSIQLWRGSGGGTSERDTDSATPHLRGISDRHGNLMVLMSYNTDIADAWEREGEDEQYFYRFSPAGYALGINVLLYTMTH